MRRKKWTMAMPVLLIAAILFADFSFCMAADKPAEPTADTMQALAEKIKADKKLLIAENMQLTPDESKKFWPVYSSYQDELFLLRMRTLDLIKEYADSYAELTNEKARKLLDESIMIEGLQVKLRSKYLPKFRAALPDMKVARYYQMENKINAAIMYELARSIPLVKQ